MTDSGPSASLLTHSASQHHHDYPQRVYAEYQGEQGLMPHYENNSSSSGEQVLPSWFRSGFRPLDAASQSSNTSSESTERQAEQRYERSAQRAPELHVAENATGIGPQLDEDGAIRRNLLQRWKLDDIQPSRLEAGGHPAESRASGDRVGLFWFRNSMLNAIGSCETNPQVERARRGRSTARDRLSQCHHRAYHSQILPKR